MSGQKVGYWRWLAKTIKNTPKHICEAFKQFKAFLSFMEDITGFFSLYGGIIAVFIPEYRFYGFSGILAGFFLTTHARYRSKRRDC